MGELTQVNRKGEQIVVESRWSLVRSDSGEPRSILIINTDVTETPSSTRNFSVLSAWKVSARWPAASPTT